MRRRFGASKGRGSGKGRGKGRGTSKGRGSGKGRGNNWLPRPRTNTPEERERRFFDKFTKDPSARFEDVNQATRFLRAAVTFADAEGTPALLYRLADDGTIAAGPMRKALEYIDALTTDGQELLLHAFLPLLAKLGQDDLDKPVYSKPLLQVLNEIYDFPFRVVGMIHSIACQGLLHSLVDKGTISWFLGKLALTNSKVREDDDVQSIAKIFGHGSQLHTIICGSTVSDASRRISSVQAAQTQLPGGRHDNDKSDFRSIRILPTPEEFTCTIDPYLPKFITTSAQNNPQVLEAQLLDRQFRLLRHDMLGPAQEALDDPRRSQRSLFNGAHVAYIHGAQTKPHNNNKTQQRQQHSDPCIMFKFHMPHWFLEKSKQQKREFWERSRRTLQRDSLVCLLRQDPKGRWVPVRFGTIQRREVDELADDKGPFIGIDFLTQQDLQDTLLEFSERAPDTRLMVASSSFFAYKPILRSLQGMVGVPFKEEIVSGVNVQGSAAQSALCTVAQAQGHAKFRSQIAKLDEGQLAGLKSALTDRVSLIQGPPGTGKTYIGALLAEIVVAMTSETILCVCYTNHALDSFLEELLDKGIKDIVRIGGRSKSPRMEEYNLRTLATERASFSREQNRRYAHLKGQIEEGTKAITTLSHKVQMKLGAKWWGTVREYLEDNDYASYQQLKLDEDDLVDQQGFQVHGVGGGDHLWKRWLKGQPPTKPFMNRATQPLWRLSKQQRGARMLVWQRALFEDSRAQLAEAMQSIQQARAELRQLQDMKQAVVLGNARVIGCTTTKAAMCKELLDEVAAGVVIVEEAAEIMEAHVLTSLSPKCKQLIMIGDHKQLRPKAEYYPLTVESGHGFDLNRSLFERLAHSCSVAQLGVQHRMHPAIAEIPRLITYPDLRDAAKVQTHPSVKGLQPDCNRVVFIDHQIPEDDPSSEATDVDSVSKTNSHEVAMVVAVARYLCQQGYRPNNLVVLTPYLGQLLKLQQALAQQNFDVTVGDVDFNEARSKLEGDGAFDAALHSQQKKIAAADSSIRVATIDNYQGEEEDIAIISLVRSNPRGDIGFLKEPERVNVMLSRARHCEIVIGNRTTLEKARGQAQPLRGGHLWSAIFDHLDDHAYIRDGLPIQCEEHGTQAAPTSPEEFTRLCPHGGCDATCGKLRVETCGHACKQQCHRGPCRMSCTEMVDEMCAKGQHPVRRMCHTKVLKCHQKVQWKCDGRYGVVHTNAVLCHTKNPRCDTCTKIEDTERAVKEKMELIDAKKKRWENEMHIRRVKAESKVREATQKRLDFEERKEKELHLRKQEHDAWVLQEEQKIREDTGTQQIDEAIQQCRDQSEKEIAKMQKEHEDMLANRATQAEQTLERIKLSRDQDIGKMETAKAEQERTLRDLVEQSKAALKNLRDAHHNEKQKMEADLVQQQAKLELETRKVVDEVRDLRNREQHLNTVELHRVAEEVATVQQRKEDLAGQFQTCSICMDDEVALIDGYLCDNAAGEKHFTCDGCFTHHVKTKMEEDLRLLEAHGAAVFCPCKTPQLACESSAVTVGNLFRHAPDAFQAHLAAQQRVLEKRLTEDIRREERTRMEEEQARLARLGALERRIHDARTTVTEDLLTLKCPRKNCAQAFVDFSGCFALTCGRCGCGFCAWCLEDCGGDAHAHVAACPENQGRNVFGTKPQFDEHQHRRRKRLVEEFLRGLEADIRMQVVQQCRKDLEDVGMQDIVAQYSAGGGVREGAGGVNVGADELFAMQLLADEVAW